MTSYSTHDLASSMAQHALPHSTSTSTRTSRPTTPMLPTASPLETLVYNCIPALAPPSRRRTDSAAARERPGSSKATESKDNLNEATRKEKVKDLVDWCNQILDRVSVIPPPEPGESTSIARAYLSTARSSRPPSSASSERKRYDEDKVSRFDILQKKLDQSHTLSDTDSHLRLLLALSSLNPTAPPTIKAPLRASRSVPSMASKQSEASRLGMGYPAPGRMKELDTKGKTKAEVMAAWRRSQGRKPLPTRVLLRDMLYLLQGIDGAHVRFSRKTQSQKNREANPYLTEPDFARGPGMGERDKGKGKQKEEEDLVGLQMKEDEITGLAYFLENEDGEKFDISESLQAVMLELSELGLLYRMVAGFVNSKEGSAGKLDAHGSMAEQSLCHFLQKELREYHRLIAVLEAQISGDSASLPPDVDRSSGHIIETAQLDNVKDSSMTFQRLSMWAADAKLRMRLMAALVGDAKASRGGALISAIYSHTSHGDPFIRNLTREVLKEVSKPFFQTLTNWIFSGHLYDPFNEFFVQLNPNVPHKKLGSDTPSADMGFVGVDEFGNFGESENSNAAYMLWEKKYIFNKEMLPAFVSEAFGKKIFSTGKSINFIRFSCHDSEWTSTQAHLLQAGRALDHDDISGLERTIDDAYSIASKRLLDIFFDRYRLLDHLRAMKRYILLTAGDFADILLECTGPRLNKEATKLLRHHLTSDVETAIQGSNASNEPGDIQRRLDARILDPQPGDLGWDVFAMDYKVEAPVNAVLDGKAMLDYYKLFAHLWRIRRVHSTLKQGWIRVTFNSRRFLKMPGYAGVWHHCHILQAQMMHFMGELQAFCQLEAIELAWQDLIKFAQAREGDLDSLIGEHRLYLKKIAGRIFLLNPKAGEEESLLQIVKDSLELILTFNILADALFRTSLAEALRLDRQRDEAEGRLPAGRADDGATNQADLDRLQTDIAGLATDYRGKMLSLVSGLESHPNYEVKFLAIRLSFNDQYKKTPRSKTLGKSRVVSES